MLLLAGEGVLLLTRVLIPKAGALVSAACDILQLKIAEKILKATHYPHKEHLAAVLTQAFGLDAGILKMGAFFLPALKTNRSMQNCPAFKSIWCQLIFHARLDIMYAAIFSSDLTLLAKRAWTAVLAVAMCNGRLRGKPLLSYG